MCVKIHIPVKRDINDGLKMSIDEAFNNNEGFEELSNITKYGKETVPHCLYNGVFQYRSVDDTKKNSFFCCVQAANCEYYKPINSKEYCYARHLK